MKRLRLVKIIVQPVFVIDDGDTLEEVPGNQLVLAPGELDAFPAKFRADMAAAEQTLNQPVPLNPPDPTTNGNAAPNRAARRAKTPS
jgi:hypothetical protein